MSSTCHRGLAIHLIRLLAAPMARDFLLLKWDKVVNRCLNEPEHPTSAPPLYRRWGLERRLAHARLDEDVAYGLRIIACCRRRGCVQPIFWRWCAWLSCSVDPERRYGERRGDRSKID
jgi:hypothetical protein